MYIKSTKNQNKKLSITVYNNTALIYEKRNLGKSKSELTIEYFDISKDIIETSLLVLGINYNFLNINYLCCTNNENKNNIPNSCLSCEELIPNSIMIKGNNYNCREIEVYYLTKNINWLSSYVIILERETLNIKSWFNLINNSGIDYLNAEIKFVAGNVRLPQESSIIAYKSSAIETINVTVEELGDYYSYKLPDKYDLNNNTLKKIKNFSAFDISYNKIYDFGYAKLVADIKIKFFNTIENNLGFTLPAGDVYFYESTDNKLEFLGGNSIENIGENREVSLVIGEALDVTAKRNILEHIRYNDYTLKKVQFIITNTKDENVFVTISEAIYSPWQMESSSDNFILDPNGNPIFEVLVPANSEKKILFTYRYNINN
ncbi:DUF4139 domain-containing protein [Clostridium isatidis]|uniref:DUF4139 domain-containing protein n=1 Tax=Clostridium isatidis TaxID=182773 RepID=A0A343JAC3_9CLOT|nr:hypothetical protein [Clostridium isatidis]ASW42481.1 hypothetical protein BEN51_03000 [Clostridium isatidis]